jgi:hypothetical protein
MHPRIPVYSYKQAVYFQVFKVDTVLSKSGETFIVLIV